MKYEMNPFDNFENFNTSQYSQGNSPTKIN